MTKRNGNQHTTPSIALGDSITTTEGYRITVVKYDTWSKLLVKFEDVPHPFEKWVHGASFGTGKIKYPYHRTLYDIGYIGYGENKSRVSGVTTLEYGMWRNMFMRCYDIKYQQKQPSYKGTSVCEEWHNFQNFAEWVKSRPQSRLIRKGELALDKDLLGSGKLYSPETCRIIPTAINSFLSRVGNYGVRVVKRKNPFYAESCGEYLGLFPTEQDAKDACVLRRKQRAQELANKWKEFIDDDVYVALLGRF